MVENWCVVGRILMILNFLWYNYTIAATMVPRQLQETGIQIKACLARDTVLHLFGIWYLVFWMGSAILFYFISRFKQFKQIVLIIFRCVIPNASRLLQFLQAATRNILQIHTLHKLLPYHHLYQPIPLGPLPCTRSPLHLPSPCCQ